MISGAVTDDRSMRIGEHVMIMTGDTILSMLQTSVIEAYGDTDALLIGVDAETGAVVACPPMSQRTWELWAIAVHPGAVPLDIEVLGTLPLEDPRFQQAIGDTLGARIRRPELLDSRELAVLDGLRDHHSDELREAI
ncbi:MAG: hypothetical protein M3173_00715 [Chloroflexota bacterium]|nr:hypothetical protein [Chloroflexota bacterium]